MGQWGELILYIILHIIFWHFLLFLLKFPKQNINQFGDKKLQVKRNMFNKKHYNFDRRKGNCEIVK